MVLSTARHSARSAGPPGHSVVRSEGSPGWPWPRTSGRLTPRKRGSGSTKAPRASWARSPAESSESARRQLRELGVDVHTNSTVTAIEPGRLRVGNEWIATNVILWATGVAASPLGKELDADTDRAGRVLVEPDLSVPGHREIRVVGDMSALTGADGKPVAGLAAAATQEGRAAAENILRDLRGEARRPFTYHDRGTMATLGCARSRSSARESCRVHSCGCSGRSCTCSC